MKLLTDSHIPAAVAKQLRRRGIDALALPEWMDGSLRNAPDELVLSSAHLEKRVLITYDCRTIPPLLKTLAETGQHHGGVILIDERTLRFNNVGGLVSALLLVCSEEESDDWEDRVAFLTK